MKKLIIGLMFALVATSSFAHDGYYGYEREHYRNYHEGNYRNSFDNRILPALIGGIIGYELRQPRVSYQTAPVYVQQQSAAI